MDTVYWLVVVRDRVVLSAYLGIAGLCCFVSITDKHLRTVPLVLLSQF